MGMKAEEALAIAISKINSGGGGTGEGDMKKSVYDSDSAVKDAGGIAEYVADKIDDLNLGTASSKDSINEVTQGSEDLVESGAVFAAVKAVAQDLSDANLAITALQTASINLGKYKADSTSIAPQELDSTSASQPYEVDDQFYLIDGNLYTCTTAIAQNDAIVVYPTSGYNCKLSDSVTEQIGAIKDSLGTASTKDSTSEVEDSTDLVESGAVKNIVGWGNKNLSVPYNYTRTAGSLTITYGDNNKVVVDGSTGNSDVSYPISSIARDEGFVFTLPAGTYTISLSGDTTNIVPQIVKSDGTTFTTATITLGTDTDIFVRVGILKNSVFNNQTCYIQLEKGSTATAYEPYHASVEDYCASKELLEDTVGWTGKNLYDGSVSVSGYRLTSTGEELELSAYEISGYLEISKPAVLHLGVLSNAPSYCFYDETKTYISGEKYNNRNNFVVTPPTNAKYIRLSVQSESKSNVTLKQLSVDDLKADNSEIAPIENGTTSSQAYAVGEHFTRGGKFCTAITSIASGATFTLNTNYVEGTIAEVISNLPQFLSGNVTDVQSIPIDGTFYDYTIPSDGYYGAYAVNDSVVGDCTLIIMNSSHTKYIAALYSESGQYIRAACPPMPLKKGAVIAFRAFATGSASVYKLT